ncbi:MAG: DUF4139 domain-containing protein, partial [Mizugakiibacter sp.]|uniref:DUF4139 domain-containing protein n=1 Tax=Mizugakiibacter sp. TaxID=1972610 RepID=UPI00320FFBD1
QTLALAGLPTTLDPEAVDLDAGAGVRVLMQRLLLPRGEGNALLARQVGRTVSVLGTDGKPLAEGELLDAGDSLSVRTTDGRVMVLRDYAAVALTGADAGARGATLALTVDSARKGAADAVLTYPAGGLGWRAAYTATLQDGAACRIAFDARASIANRSGRDYRGAALKLVAGEPNFAKSSGPRPVLMKAMAAPAAEADAYTPQQAALGDYRSYTLPQRVDLPDASVSQVPLYAARTLDCQRAWIFDPAPGAWSPPVPQLQPMMGPTHVEGQVASTLRFTAFDSLPAGYLRVLAVDRDGHAELLGEARIADTPKSRPVDAVLGTAFDLRGARERTAFHVDRAARRMDEAFRITLSNAGDAARTVTVRERPSRWRAWTLASSSLKPSRQTPDLLEFAVPVPAHGSATLDYALRYTWTAGQETE